MPARVSLALRPDQRSSIFAVPTCLWHGTCTETARPNLFSFDHDISPNYQPDSELVKFRFSSTASALLLLPQTGTLAMQALEVRCLRRQFVCFRAQWLHCWINVQHTPNPRATTDDPQRLRWWPATLTHCTRPTNWLFYIRRLSGLDIILWRTNWSCVYSWHHLDPSFSFLYRMGLIDSFCILLSDDVVVAVCGQQGGTPRLNRGLFSSRVTWIWVLLLSSAFDKKNGQEELKSLSPDLTPLFEAYMNGKLGSVRIGTGVWNENSKLLSNDGQYVLHTYICF